MFGLNIDPNNPRGNPEAQELANLGVEMVRYTFYDSSGGNQLDPQKAQFYQARARAYQEAGIESLVILTYDTYPNRPQPEADDPAWDDYIDHFAQRVHQIAQLLAPFRPAFQIWNEPDHPVRPDYAPTLRETVFARMLQRSHDAIKMVDAELVVATAGLSSGNPSWLARVIRALGGSLPADVVAFHPYGQRPDPNWPDSNWGFGYVGDLINGYRRVAPARPLWITEIGIKPEDIGHSQQRAAEYLRRYYQTIIKQFRSKVEWVHWFCYSDGMVPPFGLVEASGNRKPIYTAYREAAREAPPRPTPTLQPAPPPTPPPVSPPAPLPVPSPTPPASSGAGQLAQLATQLNTLQSQLQQLQNQTGQLNTLQSQVQHLQNQIGQLQQKIQEMAAQQIRLQSRLQQLKAQPRPEPGPGLPQPGPGPAEPPPIQDLTDQLPRHPTKRYPTRALEAIKRIVIHHTAIPPQIGARRIAEHRINAQNWPGIGYHYLVTEAGVIQQTNDLTTVSRHAARFNDESIGISFAGDFTDSPPPPQQIEAGARLIAWLLERLDLPLGAIVGHKEIAKTQSPGLQWDSGAKWAESLKARIRQLI